MAKLERDIIHHPLLFKVDTQAFNGENFISHGEDPKYRAGHRLTD